MPRNQTLRIPASTWTQLTDGDTAAIRIQSLNGNAIKIMATTADVAPTNDSGAIELNSREVIGANYTLAELWPGVVGAKRVWGWCKYSADISVSHA